MLAFNTLEKAERYYLGLYRLCPLVQQHIHRTIILCNKDEVRRVYELCRKNYFDDYVLFWPMTYDMSRLAMAVHHALRELATLKDGGPSVAEFATQARRLGELEGLLDERLHEPVVSAAPLKAWADGLRQDYAPHMEAARTLGARPTASCRRCWWPTTTNSSASSWPASSKRRTIACSLPPAASKS